MFLVSTGTFVAIAHEMVTEKEDNFDIRIISLLEGRVSPAVAGVFKLLTFFGSTGFLISAFVLVALALLIAKRRKEAASVAIAGLLSCVLLESLKFFFKRIRPAAPVFEKLDNFSFPSGHAFYSFIFYGILSLLIWKTGWDKKWKILLPALLVLFVLSIGLSRIVLRYHFSSDVIGGFCLGCSCLSLYLIYRVKRS